MSLSRDTADLVARHLVAAGQIIDEDSELALQHAIAARRMASRIAVVREAVGLAAYAVGDWTTAIAELRTYHRMTGRQTHLAELADCERALGRPERAIDLFRGADKDSLDKAGAIELLIVAAGARGDLGQHDAAVAMLQVRELTADEDAEWAVRLRYAYADALLAAGRRDEAREWFARAAAADEDNLTDAAERLLELDGVTIEGDEPEDDDDQPVETSATAAETDAEEADEEFRDEAFADEDDEDDSDEDDEDDDLVEDVDAGIDEDQVTEAKTADTEAQTADSAITGEDAEAKATDVEVTGEAAEDEEEAAEDKDRTGEIDGERPAKGDKEPEA
ncbi:Replicase polyprotein 1ab [Actinoplanes sp. NPDC048791]|uniref:tetratricopeptide repeat protein n=1 Tax=Actinoplanes sp. NPDC048791 TaxID=3154623 RepID=UPI0034032A95